MSIAQPLRIPAVRSTSRPLAVVLEAARGARLDQKQLARAAGVAPETISRAKTRGTLDLGTLVALARVVGLRICVEPAEEGMRTVRTRSRLADPKWGLAWSNPDIDDAALVHNALSKGRFDVILEAVFEHGLAFVREQWAQMLRDTDETPSARLRDIVERTLRNIEAGLADASA